MIPDKKWGSAAAEEFTGVKARQRWLCAKCLDENPRAEPPEEVGMINGSTLCRNHMV